jgi:NADPH:quinone reductase-like Zn-dependent oxidoreductase
MKRESGLRSCGVAPYNLHRMEITSVVAAAYGGPEVLSVVESRLNDPEPDQVLIEVRAAGTNPVDYKLYSGAYGDDPSNLPMSLGFEAAGIVTEVGGELEGPSGRIAVGDEVIVYSASGAYASGLLSPPSSVLAKPSTMSFEEASGLMLTGVTAIHALRATKSTAGDTLLVHGAAGGVGLMVVQIAVADGVRVIGTAGEAQQERLRSLGVEPVVYGDGLLERIRALAPAGVTAAIDLVGTDEAIDVSVALVANRERIATIVSSARSSSNGIQALGGGPGADAGVEIRSAARLELIRRMEEGSLRVFVAATYPLIEAAAAHRQLAAGHAHGKIILIP